jgi:hypothetical protein
VQNALDCSSPKVVLMRLKLSSCPSSKPVSRFDERCWRNCSMNRMLGLIRLADPAGRTMLILMDHPLKSERTI